MANEVVINVRANAESAKKGLAGIADKMKNVGRGMTVMGGAITGIGIASVATFAKMGDEVQKMALRTSFSTETLSELRHAAELSGTSLTALETGLKRMSKVIVDANDGLAESKDALDRMGVSTDDLIGKAPEKQFEILTMGLANMKDETMRMATAQEVFGRAGTQLLPMLAGGAEGLAAMKKQAHELGIVFDQETANRAADFNDSLTNLKGSMQGIAISIGGVLAPLLTDLADKMMGLVTKVSGWMKGNQGLTQTLVIVASAIGGILLVLGPLLLMLPGIIAIAPAVGAAFHIMLGPVGLVTGAITLLVAGIVALKIAWDENMGGIRQITKDVLEAIINGFVMFMKAFANPFDVLIDIINKISGKTIPTLSEQLDKLADVTFDFGGRTEVAMSRSHLQIEKTDKALKDLKVTASTPIATPMMPHTERGYISGDGDGGGGSWGGGAKAGYYDQRNSAFGRAYGLFGNPQAGDGYWLTEQLQRVNRGGTYDPRAGEVTGHTVIVNMDGDNVNSTLAEIIVRQDSVRDEAGGED